MAVKTRSRILRRRGVLSSALGRLTGALTGTNDGVAPRQATLGGALRSVIGGITGTTPTAPGANELSDWTKRRSGPSVVWAHNFDAATEVNNFRNVPGVGISQNDPDGRVTWVSTDGFAGGGCVQIAIPTGGTANHSWWRPMAALAAGSNGKATPDPAANGAVRLNTGYDPTQASANYNFRKGYYAHPAVQSTYPFWPTAGITDVYDGTEFWLQMRVKIQGTRWSPGNPPGKLLYIDITGMTGDQEIIVRSVNNPDSITGKAFFQTNPLLMYTSFGGMPNSIIGPVQGSYTGSLEPGGPYEATCTYSANLANPGVCWEFPADTWTTLLFHVIPGRDNSASSGLPLSSWPFGDCTIEVWKCDAGESAYTKLFEKFDLKWTYFSNPQSSGNGPTGQWHPPAFNSIAPSGYMNNVNAATGWYQRYTQLIFSKDWIPPPGETAPAWWTSAPDGQWTAIAGTSGQRITDVLPSPVPSSGLSGENPASITKAWTGGAVDQRRGEYLLVGNGGHADYCGNEGYALSLRSETPGWRRISSPTPNGSLGAVTSEGTGLYADGRPRAMHSTFECFGDGRVWFALQNSVTSGGGGSIMRSVSFDRDILGGASTPAPYATNPWIVGNSLPLASLATDGTALIFGVSAFDRVGHKVWGLGGNSANITSYWSIDTIGPTRGTITGYAAGKSFGHFGTWAVVAHDLRILVAGDHLRNAICVLDLDNPSGANAWTQVTNVTGTGFFAAGGGGVYVAKNRTIGIGDPRSIGNAIYRLAIPTKVTNGRVVYDPAGQWAWSNSTPAGPAISTIGSGAYSKWNIVEDMGDGRSCIVYVPDIAGPTYVYKIPVAGL